MAVRAGFDDTDELSTLAPAEVKLVTEKRLVG